jgi:hypothetical protein
MNEYLRSDSEMKSKDVNSRKEQNCNEFSLFQSMYINWQNSIDIDNSLF